MLQAIHHLCCTILNVRYFKIVTFLYWVKFLHNFRYPFVEDQAIAEPDWQIYLRDTAKMILSEQSPKKLMEIRTRLYELLVHGIPTDLIFKVCIVIII